MLKYGTYLVCGNEVADEEKDAHDDVLRNGDDIRAGDLEDLDALLNGSVQVDVVRANTSGDTELEVLRLVDDILGDIRRVERRRDEDLSLHMNAISTMPCKLRAVDDCVHRQCSFGRRTRSPPCRQLPERNKDQNPYMDSRIAKTLTMNS